MAGSIGLLPFRDAKRLTAPDPEQPDDVCNEAVCVLIAKLPFNKSAHQAEVRPIRTCG